MTDNAFKGTSSRTFTGEQIDEIAAKYREGKGRVTVAMLAAEYECSTAPIRNALKMRNVRVVKASSVLRGYTRGAGLGGRIT